MDHYNNNNDTPLMIKFQEERMGQQASTKPVQQDTQLTSFLRSSRHDRLSNTQHAVSIFGTNYFEPTYFDDLDDEDSMCSEEIFDLPLNDCQHCPTEGAVNQALRISCDTVSSFDEPYETLQRSLSSLHEICEEEEFVPETTTFNESMSSINAACEKLNACMERTAQSRKLARGGLLKRFGSSKTSVSSKTKPFFKLRMRLQRELHRASSNRSVTDRPRLSG
jgi:hypothetical protein